MNINFKYDSEWKDTKAINLRQLIRMNADYL